MIDKKLLYKDFEAVTNALKRKNVSAEQLQELKNMVLQAKDKRESLEKIQSEQNKLTGYFAVYKKEGKDLEDLQNQIYLLKQNKQSLEELVKQLEQTIEDNLLTIPNLPNEDVPYGKDESDNKVIEKIGTPKKFSFQPKEHWQLGEELDIIDFQRGVKLAKSRFSALKGIAAKLERALINYCLDFNAKYGFEEWHVPFIANANTLIGTGQLPKFEDDLFKIENEDLYLIPTAEVQLTNLFSDEILNINQLPLLLTSYTPCFRKEAGSAGRDTRGIIRQHQFDKVELVSITTPEKSSEILEKMVECSSSLLTSLELPHQKVQLCTGDLGFSAATTIDIEVWLPGQNTYREISSISNTNDFQARRAKIRYKDDKKNKFCHTLNGSSLAIGRTLVAILENHQQEDGTIQIPNVLKKYLI